MGMDPWILLPATVILFREVFVSGLREYLGDTAGLLKVTTLAKWKTTAQMVSIAVLFGSGIFAASGWVGTGAVYWLGTLLLWVAALLTAMTGWDYFSKAQPHLRD